MKLCSFESHEEHRQFVNDLSSNDTSSPIRMEWRVCLWVQDPPHVCIIYQSTRK
jgi:hypothetical protein